MTPEAKQQFLAIHEREKASKDENQQKDKPSAITCLLSRKEKAVEAGLQNDNDQNPIKRHEVQSKINVANYHRKMRYGEQRKGLYLMLHWIYKTGKTLSITEDDSFKAWVNYINPTFVIPNRN